MKKLDHLIQYRSINELDRAVEMSSQPCILSMTNTVIDYGDGIYSELECLRPVGRLDKIKQLGMANTCGYSACSSGTRLVHSLICASEIDRIAQENGLRDRYLGIIAGMTHDIATPPFSDSVALGLGLNDEEQFEYVLDSCPKFDKLLRRYSVERKDLVDVVTGKGKSIMGRLINSKGSLDVDRWSYTIYDAWNLDLLPRPKVMPYMPLKKIRGLRVDNRHVPNPFKDITIDDEKLVFNDIKSLSETLELRIKMSTDVYGNPELLAKEAFLDNISRDMMDRGIITKESLFRMGDGEFEELVCKHGGEIGSKLFQFFKFQSYGTVNASEKDVRDFLAPNVSTPFEVKRQRKFNTAADSLVTVDGKIDTYRNQRPEHAKSMEDRMSSLNKTFVYGLAEDEKLSLEVQRAQEKFGI